MVHEKRKDVAIAGLAIAVVLLATSTVYLASAPGKKGSTQSRSGLDSSPLGVVADPANGDPTATSQGSATPSITVVGTGEVNFTPDEAMVGLSVVAENVTAGEATSADAAATTAVIKALNSIGIANGSIQTTSYDVSPNYDYTQGKPPTIMDYTVTNSLQVNVTGTSPAALGGRAGQVIDTGVAAGANQVTLQFTVPNSTMKPLYGQALQQAVADASSQAQTIASSLGVSISGVMSASDGSFISPQPVINLESSLSSGAGVPTPIVPGTMTASASVQVTYGIG